MNSIEHIEFSPYKILTLSDHLNRLARNEDVFPVTVELDLVSFCTDNCWWCVDPKHMNISMKLETVLNILNELNLLGIKAIVYKGGGEPSLHKQFMEVIKTTRDYQFETGIVTNGQSLINDYEGIVKFVNYIRISIDGPTPESHQNIHNVDDFKRRIEGVKKIVKHRKKLNQRHPVIGLSFAMDYEMIPLIDKAIELGDSLEVDYILFRPPFFEEVGRQSTMTIAQGEKLRSAFTEAKKRYNGHLKIFIDYWVSDSESDQISSKKQSPRRGNIMQKGANGIEHITGRCLATPLMAIITADSNVYPCCNLRHLNTWCIGAIDYKQNISFETIWNSQQRKNILNRLQKIQCIAHCTHPLSKYNEAIEYLKSKQYHHGFV